MTPLTETSQVLTRCLHVATDTASRQPGFRVAWAVLSRSRRTGKRLRITAQFVNVADGFHLWAEKFDREAEDVFWVQAEVAVAIAQALQLRLTGMGGDPTQRRGTKNSEAYVQINDRRGKVVHPEEVPLSGLSAHSGERGSYSMRLPEAIIRLA